MGGLVRYWVGDDLSALRSAPEEEARCMHIWARTVGWLHTRAFIHDTWHPIRGWEQAIHNVHLVPDERLVSDLTALVKGMPLLLIAQELISKAGRPSGTGNLDNVMLEELKTQYAYLWVRNQKRGAKPTSLYELAAFLNVDRATLFRWRRRHGLTDGSAWKALKREVWDLAETLPSESMSLHLGERSFPQLLKGRKTR